MNTTATQPTKEQLLASLYAWIHQRPGLEYGNYGDPRSYQAELRSIRKDLHDARFLLRQVELSGATAEDILKGFGAFSGRMTWENGKLEYCTGQYWPTEYRRVVAAIAAEILWNRYRDDYTANAKPGESAGDAIRRKFRQAYGRSIQSRWFN